jgi:hypothetical protein
VPGSDEPIPQPVIEFHAKALDERAMLAETAPHLAALLALPQILDTPWVLDPAKVKSLGFGGVNRYMCADWNTGPGTSLPQKRPTYDEVQRQLDAGLDFWWNYEDGADDFNDGYAAWFTKGQRAADFGANVLKLPQGMGCYASCDMDVGLQPTHTQLESQRGFRDGYKLGPAGVYGPTVMINAAADATTSKFGWITLAKFWNHGVLADPGKGHLDQVGSAFSGSADTNNQLIAPSGSYLHALGGDDVSKQDVIDGLHEVFNIKDKMLVVPGQLSNDGVWRALVTASQGQYNSTNHILAALSALPSAGDVADAVIAAQGSAGPAGLTRQDLIDVLNSTGLSVKVTA